MFNLFLPFVDDRDLLILTFFNDFIHQNLNKLKYQDTNIFALYGVFPGAIWNGGRSLANYLPRLSEKQIEQRISYINSLGFKLHLTFTNILLEKEHLADKYCNTILDIADNDQGNCVIVANDLFKNYVQESHPKLKLSASITPGNSSLLFQNRINSDYDYVVAYAKQSVIDFASSLPQEDINKIEILASNSCANCPIPLAHAKHDSQNNLNQDFENLFSCYYKNHESICLEEGNPNSLKSIEACQKIGINKFKYSGRGENPRTLLLMYIEKFVKPEYQQEAFNEIWQKYIYSEQLF